MVGTWVLKGAANPFTTFGNLEKFHEIPGTSGGCVDIASERFLNVKVDPSKCDWGPSSVDVNRLDDICLELVRSFARGVQTSERPSVCGGPTPMQDEVGVLLSFGNKSRAKLNPSERRHLERASYEEQRCTLFDRQSDVFPSSHDRQHDLIVTVTETEQQDTNTMPESELTPKFAPFLGMVCLALSCLSYSRL